MVKSSLDQLIADINTADFCQISLYLYHENGVEIKQQTHKVLGVRKDEAGKKVK